MPKEIKLEYMAHPTLQRFHASRAFHRGIRGPRGSGKSTGCSMEAMKKSVEQLPSTVDGIARIRGAIIRNTYRELEDTTLKTWLYWFRESHFGAFNYHRMRHMIKLNPEQAQRFLGKRVEGHNGAEIEVLFRALDRPGDIKKLLSLELTWAWVNEAREIPFSIIEGLGDAIGRYPPVLDGGCTWSGMLLDTNAPDDSHWWYKLSEGDAGEEFVDIDPESWEFFTQPGGLIERDGRFIPNPEAENIDYLPDNEKYYTLRSAGKKKDHIRVYYCNQYGFVVDGKPVHEEYHDATHCSQEELKPVLDIPITVGIDFGLTPAAVFCQRQASGRWMVFDELVSIRMGIQRFGRLLKPVLTNKYKGFVFEIYGDPAGNQESQTDEKTPFQILNAMEIPAEPAYSNNDDIIRREALYAPLARLVDGKPGLLLSPKCKQLRKALQGGYCYKKVLVVGEERYHEKPNKNMYSHVAEALEYAMLGGGEGDQIIEGPEIEVDKSKWQMPHYRHQEHGQNWMA